MAAPSPSLKARALQWLAQREQSRVELRRKLLALARQRAAMAAVAAADECVGTAGIAPQAADPVAEVDALLDWLAAHRHLSDERFVEARIHARAARYGNLRIRQELAHHGTAIDDATAEQLKGSELARARAVWARKFGGEPPRDAAGRARQMRFLAARGFSADVIRRVVKGEDEADQGP